MKICKKVSWASHYFIESLRNSNFERKDMKHMKDCKRGFTVFDISQDCFRALLIICRLHFPTNRQCAGGVQPYLPDCFLSWSGLFFLWCRKKTVWQIVRRGSAPPVCVHFGPRSRFKERYTYAGWAVVGAVLVLHMCVSRCFSTYRVAKLKVSFYDRI